MWRRVRRQGNESMLKVVMMLFVAVPSRRDQNESDDIQQDLRQPIPNISHLYLSLPSTDYCKTNGKKRQSDGHF